MKPLYRIHANNTDVTARIADRLESLTLTDEKGRRSDRLELVLDDRDSLPLPTMGVTLDVWLGYGHDRMAFMGRFAVDHLSRRYAPAQMTISATAADMKKELKVHKTRSWKALNIGQIIETLAGEHGLKPLISDEFKNLTIPHLDQTNESDLNLITRLARDYGGIAKPAGGFLIFLSEGEARTASDKTLPPCTLGPSDINPTTLRVERPARYRFKAVKALWYDNASASEQTLVTNPGQPVYSLRKRYPDKASATAAAQAKLKALHRAEATLTFETPGRADLGAETPLILRGFREGFDGTWSATTATHRLTRDGGWTVAISAGATHSP